MIAFFVNMEWHSPYIPLYKICNTELWVNRILNTPSIKCRFTYGRRIAIESLKETAAREGDRAKKERG